MKEYSEDPLTRLYQEKAESRRHFEEARRRFDADPLVLDEFLAECFQHKRCPHCGSEVHELDAIRFNGFSEESHRRAFYGEVSAKDPLLSLATALSYAKWQAARDSTMRAIEQAADHGEIPAEKTRAEEVSDENTGDTIQHV